MFTGIVENTGLLIGKTPTGTNLELWIESPLSNELKIDQSVSHNGICLTVTELAEGRHKVVAIDETRKKTNIDFWEVNQKLNLERCMPANGRFDGHIVQGHVDCVAKCKGVLDQHGSYLIGFEFDAKAGMVVHKGSICVNGVSLTVVEAAEGYFSVAIIPYTWEHTTFSEIKEGSIYNIEFDIVGKYIAAMMKGRVY